ncbi:hypothetical protein ACFQ07_27220 [Actinomadura adrarensis]|uniref:Lipoprotein n=1 Tax=Actinomadura adrarensis TaxID=1819600 RepID=A0ABW3CPV5_9ACTN
MIVSRRDGPLWAVLALSVAALTACGSVGKPCTMVAARQGVGFDIKAPYAAKVADAGMKLCWAGTCHEPEIDLHASTKSVPQGCDDGVCGASASPDGGKHAFADVQDLPTTPVEVTVVLRDAGGDTLLDRTLSVTPRMVHPNGPDCGTDGPQAMLLVQDGQVTVRE